MAGKKFFGIKLKETHFCLLCIIGLVALAFIAMHLTSRKTKSNSMTSTPDRSPTGNTQISPQQISQMSPQQMWSAAGDGQPSSLGNGSSSNQSNPMNPAQLLPTDNASQWGSNKNGSGALQNVNLLQAGHHVGINTIGSSLRNPNLQLRSEPANPQNKVGPWLQSTIEPDLLRVPLELGAGPQ